MSATIMSDPIKMSDPILFDVTADPTEIAKRLKTKQLCFILNKNLKPRHVAKLIDKYYLMAVEHNNEIRHGVVCGLYKEAPTDFEKITSDTKSAQAWKDGGETPVMKAQVEEPLCVIISEFLDAIQVSMLEKVYEMLEIQYEGQTKKAIACAYYEPDVPIEGGILSQEWRLENK